jgi:hypothetical protein
LNRCNRRRRHFAVNLETLEGRQLFAQVPFTGTPFPVGDTPITIQAEDYDLGGEGIAFHDTTPTTNSGGDYRDGADGGFDVKLINLTSDQYRLGDAFAGEWVEYTLDVQQSGTYQLDLRLSQKDPNARMHVEVDGVDVTGSIAIPDTNDFSTFRTVTEQLTLTAGPRVLRLAFDAVARNNTTAGVDWLRLTKLSDAEPGGEEDPPPTEPTPQGTVVIDTTQAAYVRDATSADINFGNDAIMQVKRAGSTNNREGYLKFDVGSLAADAISGATLRIFGRLSTATGTVTIATYGVSDTTWDESTLTWNNKPASGSSAASTKTLASTTADWIEWDVTTLVKQARAAGQQFVSIALKGTASSDPYAILNSDDASSNTPQLAVTTSTPVQDLVVSTGSLSVNEGSQKPFTVKLATQPSSDVTVTISKNIGGDGELNASASTLTFTSANWDQPQTVNVSAAEDADFTNGSATFTVASTDLTSKTVTATEVDNDTPPPPQTLVVTPATMTVPEAGQNAFTVKLGTAPTSDVTVTISKNGGGDADLGAGSTSLTFTAANWDVAQTVNVTAAADADTTNGSATFTVSAAGVTSKTVVATEADDDAPPQPSTVTTSIGSYVRGGSYADRNFGTANDLVVKKYSSAKDTRETYLRFDLAGITSIANAKLRLFGRVSGSSGSVAVNVYDASNTTWGETSITWNNKPASGATVRGSVTFTGTTNKWYEADVTSFLQSALAAGQTLVTLVLKGAANKSAPVLIQSDETSNRPQLSITPDIAPPPPPQGLVVSSSNVSVNEGAQTPFTVKLAAQPSSDVTVTISKNAGDADLGADATTLTFTAANWNTAQTVNVAAAEDADAVNGSATFTVASSGLTSKTVTATEVDNDVQALVVSNANLTVAEAGNNLFTVKLAAQPTSNVSVTVSKNSGGDPDLDLQPTTLTFTPANWDTPQSVTISAGADPDITNGSATFTVASSGLTSKSVVATEVDDDLTRQPATYYVNLNGNDANAGTSPAAAWKTIAKVNAMTFIPGDSILFQGQQSFNGSIFFDATDTGADSSGNLIAPITIGAYGTGSATISSGTDFGFFAQRNGGITLQDLNFRGTGPAANANDGVAFFNNAAGNIKQSDIKLQRVTVSGYGKNGLSIGGFNGSSGYRNVSILDSTFNDNRDGVTFFGPAFNAAAPVYAHSNVLVSHVQAFENDGNSSATNPTGNGIVFGSVRDGVIERSVAHHNGSANTATTGPVGIWAYDSDRITIQHNESYSNQRGSGGDGDGFDFDQNTSNSVMQYNYAHDNDGAGFLLYTGQQNIFHDDNTVRYNVSERDGRTQGYGGIVIGGRVTDLEVYNNTIYFPSGSFGTNSAAVYITSIGDRVHFRNNILQTTGGARLISTNAVQNELLFQGNVYWSTDGAVAIRWGNSTYSSIGAWRSAETTQERVDLDGNGSLDDSSLNLDPRLAAAGTGGTIGDADALEAMTAYRLLSDSPLRDAGLDMNTRFSINPGDLDFFGTAIKQGSGFDLGADEF